MAENHPSASRAGANATRRAPSVSPFDHSPTGGSSLSGGRRSRLRPRALPLLALAGAAFLGGIVAGSGPSLDPAAERFAAAWSRGDPAAMHAELSAASAEEFPRRRFEQLLAEASETATVESVAATVSDEREEGGAEIAVLAVDIQTRIFGEVGGDIALPVGEAGVEWGPEHAFPGLEEGETLRRRVEAPERAPILAADGSALAEGPASARSSPLGAPAQSVAGLVGEPEGERIDELRAAGFPDETLTGVSGLELAFDELLAGTPGGRLLAVAEGAGADAEPELLAESEPVAGQALRTTIDPELQTAAVNALGSLFGGVAVLDASNGDVRALSGVAFSAPQPPGSTMKVVTAAAALEDDLVELDDQFPVETTNSEIGYEIANSGDAACGGSFLESFAQSCNTVFAPLGAELGGERLVDAAESFGFNSQPTIYAREAQELVDVPMSTIPEDVSDSVEVGVSAIGQGEVLATPLQMASVAQTIANDGLRSPTSLVRDDELAADASPVRVVSNETAGEMTELMKAVVSGGTGAAAALPDVQVAGKTGTAELGLEPGAELGDEDAQELDAWFTAFAPADDPELAVAVMIVDSEGDGGVVAAPIARDVLAAELG